MMNQKKLSSTSTVIQVASHPSLLMYIQDLDADHRVNHTILQGVSVSVLYDGTGDCILWYVFNSEYDMKR